MANPLNQCCLPNINEALNNFAGSVIKTMGEALGEKDQIIKAWKTRAKRLAYRYSACLDCGESQVKLIDLQCIACYEKATKNKDQTQKEAPHD